MTDERGTPRTGLFAPLRHRDFAAMWLGFLVSHVGDSVQIHTQNWLVTDLTRSGMRVGAVAVAQALPRLVFGLFSGVMIDRVDRRRLLIAMQSLAMIQSLVFLATVLTGTVTFGVIVGLAFVLGVLDTINLNARVALMPTLVPPRLIPNAVALQSLGVNVVQIAGPSLTGILIGVIHVSGCLTFNAATFVVLLLALAWMRPIAPRARNDATGVGDELREGIEFVKSRPLLRNSILLAYLLGFFGVAFARLIALYARVVIGTDARGYGLLAASVGIGAILASVLVTARASPSVLPRNIVVAGVVFAASLVLVARAHRFSTAVIALGLLGGSQMAFRSAITSAIQIATPDRLRGRVVSLLTLDFALWSLGAMLVGTLADALARWQLSHGAATPEGAIAWGLRTTVFGCAGVCAIAVAVLGPRVWRERVKLA